MTLSLTTCVTHTKKDPLDHKKQNKTKPKTKNKQKKNKTKQKKQQCFKGPTDPDFPFWDFFFFFFF